MTSTNDPPWAILRMIAGAAGLLLTIFPLLVIRQQFQSGLEWLGVIWGSTIGTVAMMCWWFSLRGQFASSRAQMTDAFLGGLILGAISFFAGFFGPMVLAPDSNQGPLLGILLTGPLGLVAGILIGTIVGFARTR